MIGVFGIFADAVGVAEQTGGRRHTPRQGRRPEPRRQVPALLPREPADRRLQQVAVLFRQVGIALRARADHPADFLGQLDDGLARIVEHGLPVPHRTPLSLHLKAPAQGDEGIVDVRRVAAAVDPAGPRPGPGNGPWDAEHSSWRRLRGNPRTAHRRHNGHRGRCSDRGRCRSAAGRSAPEARPEPGRPVRRTPACQPGAGGAQPDQQNASPPARGGDGLGLRGHESRPYP